MQAHLSGLVQVEVLYLDGKCLAHPGAGIVEKQQEGMVARPAGRLVIHLVQDEVYILRFQIGCWGRTGPLGGQRQDPLVLLGMYRILADQMLAKAMDGREPTVAGRGAIAAHGLQVGQKCGNRLDLERSGLQIRNRAAPRLCQIDQQQAQRIAVGMHRPRAGPTGTLQVLAEKGLEQMREWIGRSVPHGWRPAT